MTPVMQVGATALMLALAYLITIIASAAAFVVVGWRYDAPTDRKQETTKEEDNGKDLP